MDEELVKACQRGDREAVERLMEEKGEGKGEGKGGEEGLRGPDGDTPAHWAALNNHPSLLSLILSRAPSLLNARGGVIQGTPLHWAVRKGAAAAAVALVETHGADLTIHDGQGLSPLHAAVASDHLLLVAYLVGKGVPLDEADPQTLRTPLLWACCLPHVADPLPLLLLRYGADPSPRDMTRRTALQWAVEQGKWTLAAHLADLPIAPDETLADRETLAAHCPSHASGSWLIAKITKKKDPNHSSAPPVPFLSLLSLLFLPCSPFPINHDRL